MAYRDALVTPPLPPRDAWEKGVATLLIHFRLVRGAPAKGEEDEVSAEIQAWFENFQQKLRGEGLAEGRTKEAARAVLTALRVRGIGLPDDVRERILAENDPECLERWHERAIIAASLDDVFREPS